VVRQLTLGLTIITVKTKDMKKFENLFGRVRDNFKENPGLIYIYLTGLAVVVLQLRSIL